MFNLSTKLFISAIILSLVSGECDCIEKQLSNTYGLKVNIAKSPQAPMKPISELVVGKCYAADYFNIAEIHGKKKGYFQVYRDRNCQVFYTGMDISRSPYAPSAGVLRVFTDPSTTVQSFIFFDKTQ
ncbi:hypothetical protein AYI70_g7350 [Smittium culicis]|uniref:Uncharacterized protein n=1 Tax=Smittium culicis TaxID=133412 RepID=A0A1R1XL48_9FUNG|nr:hypothetical protein AYI70_g7350 [Smittium culicis]